MGKRLRKRARKAGVRLAQRRIRERHDHLSPLQKVQNRNLHNQAGSGIPIPMPALPDSELIATLVGLGQPRWAAEEIRRNPQLRLAAARLWVDVGDAAKGDPRARERVDYCRKAWSEMRRQEILSDDPRRGHTEVMDPKLLL